MIHELPVFFREVIGLIGWYRTPLLLLVSLALGAGGAWLIAGIPFRGHLLDHPGDRSSHGTPTPRGGGVGILIAFTVAAMTLRVPTTLLFAAVLVSVVSFYGDFIRISVRFRLVVQFFAAAMCLMPLLPRLSDYYNVSVFAPVPILFPVILLLVLLFVIGTANFYNFMDGINGMAGLGGFIGFGLLGLYTMNRPSGSELELSLSLLSLCVALACLGYLPYNIPRARVFMGDVGSVLLGFVFAALAIMLARNFLDMLCFLALLFPFYADELTTMYVRLRARESLLHPHRRHLYQLLANECRIAHWKVAAAYGVAQLAISLGVLTAYPIGVHVVFILLIFSFFAFSLVTYVVRKKVVSNSMEVLKH
jgi:Fuc2NAc and GlcNAc transferase